MEAIEPIEYLSENALKIIDELLESEEITSKQKIDVYRGRSAIYPYLPIGSLGSVMNAVANGLYTDTRLPISRARLIEPKKLGPVTRLFFDEVPVSFAVGFDLE